MSARAGLRMLLAAMLVTGCAAPAPKPFQAQRPRVDLSTPLPPAFEVELPREDLPAGIGKLAGIWRGEWWAPDQPGAPGVPHTLVIRRIEGTGPSFRAPVIWSVGGLDGAPGTGEPGFLDLVAEVAPDGALTVIIPGRGRAVYRLSPAEDTVAAEAILADRAFRARLRRYPEWGLPPGTGDRGPDVPQSLVRPRGRPPATLACPLLVAGTPPDEIRWSG